MQDNNLVMALLGAGVVFVLVIVVYNQWQIRKARRPEAYNPAVDETPRGEGWTERAEPALGGERDEISRVEPRLEPGFSAKTHTPATGSAETEAGVIGAELTPSGDDAALEAAEMEAAAEPAPGSLEPANGVIDPLIDCIVPLHPEREVSGDRLLPALTKLRRAGTKQVHVEGLNPAANAWEAIRAGQRYLDVQVAVQLANRTGPLNALEFSEFINAIDPLSEAADAVPELPDMNETISNARELDAFAAECDVQLGVSVISDGAPWSAAYVQTVATQDGLVLSRDGTRFTRFHAGADGVQRALFTLQFGDTNFLRDDLTVKAGRQITLLLDVPVAEEASKPFKLVCEYAYTLSQRMGAQVVDDNLRPLTEQSFVAIQKHLRVLYDKLEARGIPAGSSTAVRLFSH
ncbi:MAG: cell division protein ZipA C-terminal FtsZ-binding domain-containing protein [Ralstonia sp.]|uniref:Cell division protein ZipA n=1 Tax=Ralstonia pickettii TaxID=329 RepID=A0A9Q2C221_RALPI|nr:cell division protein ZipA C-terminal FtsZ-binding domain-containing protein [Ralstonia pickettii]MBA9844952.1 cell division protein FtsZ [Ralstonia pickettii]MBA9850466.1 cell division protein FtsZ [Ralstonia pickettii]MBA9877335.1 cell division protein FtsZ [Ralstonia pickettii]MBA9881587.1 cell division protein FtsZ [Ralstonia pickettii]MBA9887196.1 cell division protein FtsZ [Ralstonia pickettii]